MENESKLRLLALYKILNEKSDEGHPTSTVELIAALKNDFGISAHRTTVSTDIAVLKSAGADIEVIESTQNKYYMASRKFEIPELKKIDENTSAVTEEVAVSPVFFRWVFGFGGKIKIKSPGSVKKEYAETVESAYKEVLKEQTL